MALKEASTKKNNSNPKGAIIAIMIMALITVCGVGAYLLSLRNDSANDARSMKEMKDNAEYEEQTSTEESGEALRQNEVAENDAGTEMDNSIIASETLMGDTDEAQMQKSKYEAGIHKYSVILDDCTWDEAYQFCESEGGHLVTFEDDEEYRYVASLLNENQNGYYFIGGVGVNGQYYWITPDNTYDSDNPCTVRYEWMLGEPSYADGDTQENRMVILYRESEGRWVWNDVPADILEEVPHYTGRVGYICEYEKNTDDEWASGGSDRNQYILPGSDTVVLTEADLIGMTADELRLARNEIYARHGRIFNDPELQAYFNTKSWYAERLPGDQFTDDMLSVVERANIALIKEYESKASK